jgi:hypothetical protein
LRSRPPDKEIDNEIDNAGEKIINAGKKILNVTTSDEYDDKEIPDTTLI